MVRPSNIYMNTRSTTENSQRAFTSERMVLDLRRPDWRTPMKARVKKTFNIGELFQKKMYNVLGMQVTVHLALLYVLHDM